MREKTQILIFITHFKVRLVSKVRKLKVSLRLQERGRNGDQKVIERDIQRVERKYTKHIGRPITTT